MGTVHNDRDLQSGRSWENSDQGESIVHVTGLLKMRPSKPDHAGDANLSLLAMQFGHTSGSKRRQSNRTEGAGKPLRGAGEESLAKNLEPTRRQTWNLHL